MTRLLPIACGGVLISTILAIVGRDAPLVGHDYRYFLPRLIDTDLHLRLNGLAVQWYTPTFGGGLPAFPNPQHLQYSLVQMLTLVMNPWMAVQATTAVAAFIGLLTLFLFARRELQLAPVAATLGALFFVGNGFYIEHLIVGHLGFQLFPLGAVMLYALAGRGHSVRSGAAALALAVTLMIYHAGFFLVLVLSLSVALTLAMLAVIRPGTVVVARTITTIALGMVLAGGMCAAKTFATWSLMQQFPRTAGDVFAIGPLQALAGLGAQLAGGMVLVPLFALLGLDVVRVSPALLKLTGADVRIGIWEVDTGLSPVLIAALVWGVYGVIRHARQHGWSRFSLEQRVALVVLCLGTWLAVEMTLARGLAYPFLKSLPVLNSLHVNHRVAAVFILPLSIAGALIIDRRPALRAGRGGASLIVLALLAPAAYFALPSSVHFRSFDTSQTTADYGSVRAGERFAVAQVIAASDAEALSAHASSLQPYEPLFGYANEAFAPQVQPGDVRLIDGGYLNMTNPVSLVFPKLSGLRPFERIRAGDRASLDAFVARRQPEWPVPMTAKVLEWLAALSLAATLLLAVIPGFQATLHGPR